MLALNPEREALLKLHGLRAGALHDLVEKKQLRELVRTNASASGIDDDVSLVPWRVATYTDDPRAGASLISSFASEASNSPLQIRDHAALALMFAAYDRWRDAFREIEVVERSDKRMAAETRANIELSWPQALLQSIVRLHAECWISLLVPRLQHRRTQRSAFDTHISLAHWLCLTKTL